MKVMDMDISSKTAPEGISPDFVQSDHEETAAMIKEESPAPAGGVLIKDRVDVVEKKESVSDGLFQKVDDDFDDETNNENDWTPSHEKKTKDVRTQKRNCRFFYEPGPLLKSPNKKTFFRKISKLKKYSS